jgi:hypothetical protein
LTFLFRNHINRIWEVINNPPSNVGADLSEGIAERAAEEKKAIAKASAKNVALPASESVFKTATLGSFYEETILRFKETDSLLKEAAITQQLPLKAVTSISLSNWNPPPPSRSVLLILWHSSSTSA